MDKEKAEGLKKLACDLYKNHNFEYNGVDGNDALRKMIMESVGGEWTLPNFQRHKIDIYEIVSVAVDAIVPTILTNQFDRLADIRTVSLGTKPVFQVSDPRMVRVGKVSAGNQDLRRQTITNKKYTIGTDWYGAKVYAEFEQFMNGEIDWSRLVNNVGNSFSNYIEQKIGEGLTDSYTSLNTKDKIEGKLTLDGLVGLAQRVQTKASMPVSVYGTKLALSRVANLVNMSDTLKDQYNKYGMIGTVSGLPLMEIPQAFKVNTDEFALDDNSLLILPQNEKIIGVVMEGAAYTKDIDNTDRNDMQYGFVTEKKFGVSVLQMKVYGMIKMTA